MKFFFILFAVLTILSLAILIWGIAIANYEEQYILFNGDVVSTIGSHHDIYLNGVKLEPTNVVSNELESKILIPITMFTLSLILSIYCMEEVSR